MSWQQREARTAHKLYQRQLLMRRYISRRVAFMRAWYIMGYKVAMPIRK